MFVDVVEMVEADHPLESGALQQVEVAGMREPSGKIRLANSLALQWKFWVVASHASTSAAIIASRFPRTGSGCAVRGSSGTGDVGIAVGRQPTEARSKLAARGDVELGEDAVQVRAHRAVRQKEASADLAIGKPFRREPSDLRLLTGEHEVRAINARDRRLAGCSELSASEFGPVSSAHGVERRVRGEEKSA